MPSSSEQGAQPLRPKARLVRAIGDQLISNEIVAVLELVKNAYDADATCALVLFVPEEEFAGRKVQIIDDGVGMSLETLRGAWMEPATDWKRDHPRSERFNRRVLGEKGLGRFAAARVADHFYVTSRMEDEEKEARVLLDWTAFDVKDRYLDEVLVLWEVTPVAEVTPGSSIEDKLVRAGLIKAGEYQHGTVLNLEMLRRNWTHDDFQALQRALSRLISPFESEIPTGFAIYLEPPKDFSEFAGRVGPPNVVQHPHYSLDGTIMGDGTCDLRVTTPGGGTRVREKFVLKKERAPQCGPFEIKLRVWDRDEESIKSLAQELAITPRELRRDIDAIGGVNVYRDHFRILPYGETGNDWIGLDSRRVQNPTLRVSNNQVSGYVFISAEGNPLIVDQSNREGFFENQATKDLRELLVHAISLLENARYEVRPRRETSKSSGEDDTQAEGGLFRGFSLDPLRKTVEDLHPKDDILRKAIGDSQRQLDEGVSRVKNVLSRYQRLATLGSLMDLVLHEGRQPVTRIRYDVDDIRNLLERTPPEALYMVVPRILTELSAIDKNADLLSAVFKKMDPFSGRQRGRPQDVVLEDEIRSGVALVQHELTEVGATISVPSSRTTVRVDPADVQMIVKNLVQNSAYWLQQVARDKRKVAIEVNRPSDGIVEIVVSDSGPGVHKDDQDKIWRPYFTRKPDGIGLGLSITGEIVEDLYGGELKLTDGPLPGATFIATLKRRVG